MKIYGIHSTQPKQNFKSNFRTYTPLENKNFKGFGASLIRTSTNIFRTDINLKNIIEYSIPHFADKDWLNFLSLAASDGSGNISFSIALHEFAPKSFVNKFKTIKGCDIDKEIIKVAQNKRINIFSVEFAMAERLNGFDVYKYFENKKESLEIKNDDISGTDVLWSYEPIKEIRDSLEFYHSDALTELTKLKDEGNSIIKCSNVFPYMSYKYADNVIQAAKEKLKKGSLFIIGDFDREVRKTDKVLLENDFFNPIEGEPCVFEKK